MPLPSVNRLSNLPFARWADFGRYLRAKGLTSDALDAINRSAASIPVPMRRPSLGWHARRAPVPFGSLARIFALRDPVPATEALDALGGWFDALLDAGLLVRDGDAVVSPFILNVYDDLLVFVDDLSLGEDAVMGSGPTTLAVTVAAIPKQPVARALDLGCGAGTSALVLARHAKTSIGVDINPRAIAIARFNAALNGLENVELRRGDMFAPVSGEQFDVIVSQPPFVPRPEGEGETTYLYGGRRGDELPLRALGGLAPHLAPGGRAVLLVDWPELDGDPIADRVRAAVPDDHDLLMLQCPPTDPDGYCVWFAAATHDELGPEYQSLATRQRDHFERSGISALRRTFNVIERARAPRGLTATVEIRAAAAFRPTRARIDKQLAARRLLAEGEDALLDATLRIPKGTTFVDEKTEPMPGAPAERMFARLPEGALQPDVGLNEEAFTLVSLIHAHATVRDAVDMMVKTLGADPDFAKRKILPHAREALARGLLQVA